MNNMVLHPDIILKRSSVAGFGLFASKDIPIGTVIWKYGNVRVYTKEQYDKFSERYKAILRHFCYEGSNETLVYCTDNSKYFNHSCDPNTMSIDTEKDITIKDVFAGEELTYDYGYWYLKWNDAFMCHCGSDDCRRYIKREPQESPTIRNLETMVKKAWENSTNVIQPLLTPDS
ncbi:MAG: SET domain-containing protein [Candidatus Ratteibacteria bacterium]|nr:SET domain-containing protein [Candidatus Ratteibacteria bacterium]